MKKCNIGIIGGAGRMGMWFKRFFESVGHTVHSVEAKEIQHMESVAGKSDVVVVSVPIGETCKVIEQIGPSVPARSLLMDVTSIKREPVESMLKHAQSEVIGTHPLFGPDSEGVDGQTIVLCPARGDRWLVWLRDLLSSQGARVEISSPEKHDRMMAIVQAMGHISTILMGLLLKELDQDLSDLDAYSTPLFKVHMGLIGRLFNKNPRLYAEMIVQNPEAKHLLAIYGSLLDKMQSWVDEGRIDRICEVLSDASAFFDPAKAASLAASKHLIDAVSGSSGKQGLTTTD